MSRRHKPPAAPVLSTEPAGTVGAPPRPHVPAGRINGIHAPVGTLLGPKEVTRELVVVTGNDERGVTVGYARIEDIDAVTAAEPGEPRSKYEADYLAGRQQETRLRLLRLFGRPR